MSAMTIGKDARALFACSSPIAVGATPPTSGIQSEADCGGPVWRLFFHLSSQRCFKERHGQSPRATESPGHERSHPGPCQGPSVPMYVSHFILFLCVNKLLVITSQQSL